MGNALTLRASRLTLCLLPSHCAMGQAARGCTPAAHCSGAPLLPPMPATHHAALHTDTHYSPSHALATLALLRYASPHRYSTTGLPLPAHALCCALPRHSIPRRLTLYASRGLCRFFLPSPPGYSSLLYRSYLRSYNARHCLLVMDRQASELSPTNSLLRASCLLFYYIRASLLILHIASL